MPEATAERLTVDDLAYLQDSVAEATSLQTSANTIINFCQSRLAKKYNLSQGCNMDSKTGIITRPKPELVQDDKTKENPN